MKSLFFDAGPVISLATNNLLWVLAKLKANYGGKFYFSGAVKKELIDIPYRSKKFKFEAIQIMKAVEEGTFEIVPSEKTADLTKKLLEAANSIYFARGVAVRIVHTGEMDSLAGAILMNSDAVVIDERTTRMLLEDPYGLKDLLRSKLRTFVKMDEKKLDVFRSIAGKINVIRSAELVTVAYEMGLLNSYLPKVPRAGSELLDGMLWGIKLNGCSLTREEIDKVMSLEFKK
ncbi:hypothetical protein KY308_02365 [Candidatus Woesearchaeota archaeon]|nr:hypothetical protein [Candidatus Woesearchaeota archaeon]